MAQPRYNTALQEFIRDWRPNKAELGDRFIDAVRRLVAAILTPPVNVFEVETILTPDGGKVVLRLADYEAQIRPVEAQHLALSLVEAASSARTESWLVMFLQEELEIDAEMSARVIGRFREYRVNELRRDLQADLEARSGAGAAAEGKP